MEWLLIVFSVEMVVIFNDVEESGRAGIEIEKVMAI